MTELHLPYHASSNANPAPLDIWHDVQQFLFTEAALLDERKFSTWLDLLADELRYRAPARYNTLVREPHREFGGENDAAHFDDTKEYIALRIRRLATGKAWSEDPPSRTRHLISNVRARVRDDDLIEVDSNFLVYRGRADDEVELFSGARHDTLRRTSTSFGFQLVERVILFDHTTIHANNLGIFF
jgi:3-phenylpropionate/cinnamic acid dioxygenase small subunit